MLDWTALLKRWSKELTQTELARRLNPPAESPDWLGFAPASEEEIAAAERRLGVLLPPSYRAFLETSNGWRRTTPFIGRIRPAGEINWFRVENEQWAEIYAEQGSDLTDTEYFDYAEGGAPDHRASHMKSLLQISDVDDGVYLLNPDAVTPDGEWEAWFFANWTPGATRYPSFAHMMIAEYQTFRQLEKLQPFADPVPTLPVPVPDVPRIAAKRTRARRPKAPSLESLVEDMGSTDPKTRAKAVRIFLGRFRGRLRGDRRPDLIQPLCDLFYSSPDSDVRSVCIQGLTEFADDDNPPKPLFDALFDPDPGIVLSGTHALYDFPNREAWKPLCDFIDSRKDPLVSTSAILALSEIGDERAVPTLTRVLLDNDPPLEQNLAFAAQALARCGPQGLQALLDASFHEDARIRFAATVGLDVSEEAATAQRLDELENDPDPLVSKRAKHRHGKPFGA